MQCVIPALLLLLILVVQLPQLSLAINVTRSSSQLNDTINGNTGNTSIGFRNYTSNEVASSNVSDFQIVVNSNLEWNNSTINQLNSSDAVIDIRPKDSFSGLTCDLLRPDGKTEGSDTCLYRDTLGHIEYHNLSGDYIFRINGRVSGTTNDISREYHFTSTGKAIIPTVSKKPIIHKPLFEVCPLNYSQSKAALYIIQGITNPVDITMDRQFKINLHRNLVNETVEGQIVQGQNRLDFLNGSIKTATNCVYWLPPPVETLQKNKILSPYGSPFVDCRPTYSDVVYSIDISTANGLKFNKGEDTRIRIEITNDYSGQMIGHIRGYQLDVPFYVTKLTSTCI